MKVTLFTSNKSRHNYLINLLSKCCDQLYVIQECETIFPGIVPGRYNNSTIMSEYFKKVNKAQYDIFGDSFVNEYNKNIKILPIQMGDLNNCSLDLLKPFLESNYYIVFGSSYIKKDLIEFLINKKAINIHMGISPYYRGNDCNFWALYDNNPQFVGSTIHHITKGLDNGPILYHALSKNFENIFLYTMSAVKAAFVSISKKIENDTLSSLIPIPQDKNKEIRYSTNEFNEKIVIEFNNKTIDLKSFKFDLEKLKDPFFID